MIIPVILSGGAGTRLWPLSRKLHPKQFLPLVEDLTLLQRTVVRTGALPTVTEPIVVCNDEHRFIVAEQLRAVGISPAALLLEPVGRNTAPAVAVAALQALREDDDPVLLVLPADHVIADGELFRCAVEIGLPFARDGRLITFGVMAKSPETGYGYIKVGDPLSDKGVYWVDCFVEKPDAPTARAYLAEGRYYWNSGMFMFRAKRFLEELERLAPEMLDACRRALTEARADLDFVRLNEEAFKACPSDSIDYAVMERTNDSVVVHLDAGWSDVGSWSSLWEVGIRDEAGNVVNGDVITVDAKGSFLHAEGRLVAAVGVENLVIVETADAVLVAPKERVQDVKTVVKRLDEAGRGEAIAHRKIYRPWGSYDCIDFEERFQVKRITVNPGATLSLQMHHHRAEHWIVVKGTARITRGEKEFLLSENQSTYIPLGIQHRLENPGKIPLELIEVQSGSYLGEDDIVRFDDAYGRHDAAVD